MAIFGKLDEKLNDLGDKVLKTAADRDTLARLRELVETHQGRLEPVLESIREQAGHLEELVATHPRLSAATVAAALKHIGGEGWTHANVNFVSLNRVFNGKAGFLSRSALALGEGYKAGKAVVRSASNGAHAAVEAVSGHGTAGRQQKNLFHHIRNAANEGKEWTVRGKEIRGLSAEQVEDFLLTLDEAGLTYKVDRHVKALLKDHQAEIERGIRSREVAERFGGIAGLMAVFKLADTLSKDIKEKFHQAPVPPTPPEAPQV